MGVLLCWLGLALVVAAGSAARDAYEYIDNDVELAFNNFSLTYLVQGPPSQLLTIIFGAQAAMLGNQLCTAVTLYYPFFYYEASPRSLNTLVCFNPDFGFYYTNTYELSYLITVVVNIPGSNIYQGDLVIDYKAALPPVGAGPTRNVCLMYKQQYRIDISTELLICLSTNILQFNITDFAKEHRLGEPYAGNFYLTQLTLCESDGCGNQVRCGTCAQGLFY